MAEKLWTAQEVADFFDVPLGTIYQWNSKGTGPQGIRVGKHVRYSRAEVDRWCAAQRDGQGKMTHSIESTAEDAISALIARDGSISDYLVPRIAQCEEAGSIPQLGTAAWEHLDDGDPRKVGAVFVAAREWTTITSLRRWTVLDAPRQAEVERRTTQREASYAVSSALDWSKQSRRPSHSELVRRRAEVA